MGATSHRNAYDWCMEILYNFKEISNWSAILTEHLNGSYIFMETVYLKMLLMLFTYCFREVWYHHATYSKYAGGRSRYALSVREYPSKIFSGILLG
jgi:hypothetical protein